MDEWVVGSFFGFLIAIFVMLLLIHNKLCELCNTEFISSEVKKKFKEDKDNTFKDPYQEAWEGDPSPAETRIKTI